MASTLLQRFGSEPGPEPLLQDEIQEGEHEEFPGPEALLDALDTAAQRRVRRQQLADSWRETGLLTRVSGTRWSSMVAAVQCWPLLRDRRLVRASDGRCWGYGGTSGAWNCRTIARSAASARVGWASTTASARLPKGRRPAPGAHVADGVVEIAVGEPGGRPPSTATLALIIILGDATRCVEGEDASARAVDGDVAGRTAVTALHPDVEPSMCSSSSHGRAAGR
jgi:hypothetical protein